MVHLVTRHTTLGTQKYRQIAENYDPAKHVEPLTDPTRQLALLGISSLQPHSHAPSENILTMTLLVTRHTALSTQKHRHNLEKYRSTERTWGLSPTLNTPNHIFRHNLHSTPPPTPLDDYISMVTHFRWSWVP